MEGFIVNKTRYYLLPWNQGDLCVMMNMYREAEKRAQEGQLNEPANLDPESQEKQ